MSCPRVFAILLLLVAGLSAGGAGGAAEPGPGETGPVAATLGEDGIQRATIILDSYSYRPNHLLVQAGKPVELTLESVTFLTPHNFILDDPSSGLKINEDVSAGKTVVVRFTPLKAGTFLFYCDKQLLFFKSHREKGMEGRLEVRP